jgi:hypothetical protein
MLVSRSNARRAQLSVFVIQLFIFEQFCIYYNI